MTLYDEVDILIRKAEQERKGLIHEATQSWYKEEAMQKIITINEVIYALMYCRDELREMKK